MELAIRQAIEEACPDLVGFEVEGVAPESNAGYRSWSPLERAKPNWIALENAEELGDGAWMPVRLAGQRLVVCRVEGNLYAYRNQCPACNLPFGTGTFEAGLLQCPLGHRYDVQHAGRSDEMPTAHLDPLPLLLQGGRGESGNVGMKAERAKVIVQRAVQGVGFRPFVYRLATESDSGLGLKLLARRLHRGQKEHRPDFSRFCFALERESPPRGLYPESGVFLSGSRWL